MTWRLENHRRYPRWAKLAAADKKLLAAWKSELQDAEESGGFELIDVVAAGSVVHRLVLWPFGSGVLVRREDGRAIADILQHGFDAHFDDTVREQLAAAYAEAKDRLGIGEAIDFRPGQDTRPAADVEPAGEDALAAIRALRARVAADSAALVAEQPALADLARTVLRIDPKLYRPVPVRRLFELTVAERELLELLQDAREASQPLWWVGFPDVKGRGERANPPGEGELGRYLGRVKHGILDDTIVVGGQPHPIWCLVHDAVHGVRSPAETRALLGVLSAAQRIELLRALFFGDHPDFKTSWSNRLTRLVAADYDDTKRDIVPPKQREAQLAARRALVAGLLDDAGDAFARALIEETSGWIEKAKDRVDTIAPEAKFGPRHQPWEPLLAALRTLADHARTRGEELDAAYDEQLAFFGRARGLTAWVADVLDCLPRERAERLCGTLELVERFPSDTTARTAVKLLEGFLTGTQLKQFAKPDVVKMFTQAFTTLGPHARPHLLALQATLGDAVAPYLARKRR